MGRHRPLRWAAVACSTAMVALGALGGASGVASAATRPSGGSGIEAACGPVARGTARCFVERLVNPADWRGTHVRADGHGATNGKGHGGGGGSATIAGYYPSDLLSAYNLSTASTSDGTDQTVAVVEAYSDPYLAANLATYRSEFSLGGCTTSSGCLTIVNQSGGTKLPHGNTGWGTEMSLDVEMVSAICPNCKILVVEASTASLSNLAAAAAYAGKHANVVSNSYGGSESSGETSYNADYTASHTVYVASAGDSGYGVEFPAAAPSVVAAGGTTLTQDSSTARGWTESVWSGSGSGCSAYEHQPSWQTSDDSLCGNRIVADTAADANPSTGVAIYDTYGESGWIVVGGTSVASPLIASVYALAGNASTLGPDAAENLYASGASLNKVTSGSNGSCGNYLCNAGDSVLSTGYNGPTGNGTPDGTTSF